jgi:hypothetical protein
VLSNEVMGAFCLGVVWLNALLIALHVIRSARALAVPAGVVEAKVVEAGEGGLAEVRVAQLGRAITTGGPDRILFTESSRTAHVLGGAVEIGGERVAIAETESAVVWPLASAGVRADTDFEAAYRAASTNRGVTSELVLRVGAIGDRVWIARDGGGTPTFVADVDPRSVVSSGRARATAFVIAAIATLAGITALALVRPWFSGWSTLGGALAVAYFLGVQPLAVALREAIAPPPDRRVGGEWSRPAGS